MLSDEELNNYIIKIIEQIDKGFISSFHLGGLGQLFFTIGDIKDRNEFYLLGNTFIQISNDLNPENRTSLIHYLPTENEKKEYLTEISSVLKELPSALSDEVKVLQIASKLYKVSMDMLWKKGSVKLNSSMFV